MIVPFFLSYGFFLKSFSDIFKHRLLYVNHATLQLEHMKQKSNESGGVKGAKLLGLGQVTQLAQDKRKHKKSKFPHILGFLGQKPRRICFSGVIVDKKNAQGLL